MKRGSWVVVMSLAAGVLSLPAVGCSSDGLQVIPVGAGGAGAQDAGSGGTGGTGGASAGCSPCNQMVDALVHKCAPSGTATCVEQQSDTTSADGTETKIQNKCYADGTKTLQTNTPPHATARVDAGASTPVTTTTTTVEQMIAGGAACGTIEEALQLNTTGTTFVSQMGTVTVKDATGSVVATVSLVDKPDGHGGVTETTMVTCPGQPPEPYVICHPFSTLLCSTGACM
jgi:hypothetical protein